MNDLLSYASTATRRTSGGHSRRILLRRSACLAGGALLLPAAIGSIWSARPAAAAPVGGRLYTFETDANGFITKTFFYDTGAEVVAFGEETRHLNQAFMDLTEPGVRAE